MGGEEGKGRGEESAWSENNATKCLGEGIQRGGNVEKEYKGNSNSNSTTGSCVRLCSYARVRESIARDHYTYYIYIQ